MLRGVVLVVALVLSVPVCVAVGVVAGFYILYGLYEWFDVDFPTEVSILVLLAPGIALWFMLRAWLLRMLR